MIPRQAVPKRINQGLNAALKQLKDIHSDSHSKQILHSIKTERTLYTGSCPVSRQACQLLLCFDSCKSLDFSLIPLWLQYGLYLKGKWSNGENERGLGLWMTYERVFLPVRVRRFSCYGNKLPVIVLKQEHTFYAVWTFIETESQRKNQRLSSLLNFR